MKNVVLSLCKHEEYPVYLEEAIDIAVMLMNTTRTPDEIMIPTGMPTRLYNSVNVAFRSDASGKYGWTMSSSDTIYVNEVMRDRLELLERRRMSDTKEYLSILFMMAVVIAYGCMNLLGEWMSTSHTRGKPTKTLLFRKLLDAEVFDGSCRLLIEKPADNEWTKRMRVVALVIQRKSGDVTVEADALLALLEASPGSFAGLGQLQRLERPKGTVIHMDIRPPAPAPAPALVQGPPAASTKARAVRRTQVTKTSTWSAKKRCWS